MRVLLCAFGIENLDYMLSTSKDIKYVLTIGRGGFITNMILVKFYHGCQNVYNEHVPLIGIGLINLPKYGEDRFSGPHTF